MAKHAIVWSERARSELKEALAFYAERNQSPTYSLQLLEKVNKAVRLLSLFPQLGRISDDGSARIYVIDDYLLIYELVGPNTTIISFWNGRQEAFRR